MNKINLKGLDETIVHEKLDNGLNIYVLRKKQFNSYSAYLIANYGAAINEFQPINESKMHKFPDGIAHFLEHKMFEQESGPSVMEKFSSLGGVCNAFTNYEYTTYYVNGTDNFYENLNFLIDYVQDPYFTDENVKKEKEIIDQERLMGKDNPYRIFHLKILDNLFVNYNYGKLVEGEKEDIFSITKEDLYRCYNTFYNPSNMSLIIVSNESEKKVIEEVKKNQSKKKFDKSQDINIKRIEEPLKVYKEYEEIYGDISKTEVAYSIKIPFIEDFDKEKYTIYIYCLLLMNFGKISNFPLELKEKNLIDSNIGVNVDKYGDYIIVNLTTSSDEYKKVISLFKEKIDNLELSEEIFNLLKKNLVSRFVYYFMSIDSIMNYLYAEYYDSKEIQGETFIKYKELNYDELKFVNSKLNLSNVSVTIMKPLKNKE